MRINDPSAGEAAVQRYGIVLNFEGASGFEVDPDMSYYFILELKRSSSDEYADSVNAISRVTIPLTIKSVNTDYGYRMTTNTSELSVNLNSTEDLTLNIKNEFSGETLADNSDITMEYELLYNEKGTDTYVPWNTYETSATGDIRLQGLVNGNKSSAKNLKTGNVVFRPCYLYPKDVTDDERRIVLRLIGVEEADFANYIVVPVTIQQEREYLKGQIDADLLGSASKSCLLITPTAPGSGLKISLYNIDYCTEEMYREALQSVGITDADVVIAAARKSSGTSALTGIYLAPDYLEQAE